MALRGAEIFDIPLASTNAGCGRLGGPSCGARSIENLALVVSTQNMVEPGGRGLAFVTAPEELL